MKQKNTIGARILGTLGTLVIFFLLLLVGTTMGVGVSKLISSEPSAELTMLLNYFSFIGIWILVILYPLIRKSDRPILKTLWVRYPGNNLKMFLIGVLGFGFGLNMLCAAAAMLNGDIHLYYSGISPLWFIGFFVCVMIQSGAEELLDRVFLYQRLRKLFPNQPWVAILGNALLFSLIHIFNSGVTGLALLNIVIVGVLYSLIVYYTGSVWCAIAAHTGWNFTQNIILGLPNSGTVTPISMFKLDAANAMDSVFYNVGFGVEGTVFACVVLLAACVGVWLYAKKKGLHEKEYIWEAETSEQE